MKMHNKKILDSTKSISSKSYKKAMDDAYRATHPSPKVLRKGAKLSSGVGVAMVVAGTAGLVLGKNTAIAVGTIVSGTIITIANFANATKK